jgi:hypothetical protein
LSPRRTEFLTLRMAGGRVSATPVGFAPGTDVEAWLYA